MSLYSNTSRIYIWTLVLTANAVLAKRKGIRRSNEEIAIGVSILGVFLVIVAASVLYCRFCTKRKREERKARNKTIDIEMINNVSQIGAERKVPSIDITPPKTRVDKEPEVTPDTGGRTEKDGGASNTSASPADTSFNLTSITDCD